METRLENNEVRLPKNDSFELSPNNKTNVSPIKSPATCQYFKSSFARSLSFNTNHDFELSFRISKCDTTSPSEDMDLSSAVLPATPKPFSTIPKRKYTSNRLQVNINFNHPKNFNCNMPSFYLNYILFLIMGIFLVTNCLQNVIQQASFCFVSK